MNICSICSKQLKYFFNKKILKKYNVSYYKCENCGQIQTEEPYWLKDAYDTAITYLDIGMLYRSDICLKTTTTVLENLLYQGQILDDLELIDFAAGYGVFVRKMRDNGFNAVWQDDYCENLFAKEFEYTNKKYDFLTAFEVFEHVDKPWELLNRLMCYSEIILFSTELSDNIEDIENWWYLTPSTGQHINFYTKKSLTIMADSFEMDYFTKGNFHLFIPKHMGIKNPFVNNRRNPYYLSMIKKIRDILKLPIKIELVSKNTPRKSFLNNDFNYLLNKQKEI